MPNTTTPLLEALAASPPDDDGPVTLPVWMAVGSNVYTLGVITGRNADELCTSLAEMAEWLAAALRTGDPDVPS